MPNLMVCDAISETGHRVRADVAAVGHDGGQDLAHVVGFALSLLPGRHELVGEVQIVIDLNQQFRQLYDPQVLAQPLLQII